MKCVDCDSCSSSSLVEGYTTYLAGGLLPLDGIKIVDQPLSAPPGERGKEFKTAVRPTTRIKASRLGI